MDQTVQNYIANAQKVLIISSLPLDADSISSGIILKKYLLQLGKEVTLVCPADPDSVTSEYFAYVQSLPYFDELKLQDTIDIPLTDFNIIFLVDGRNLTQFYNSYKPQGKPINVSEHPIVIQIDHHAVATEQIATYTIQNSTVSSTTELLLTTVVPIEFLDKELALLAYAGLVEDTGNFKWMTSSTTLALASKLLEKNIDMQMIINQQFNAKSEQYMTLLKWCIEHIEYDKEHGTVFLKYTDVLRLENNFTIEDGLLIKDAFLQEIAGSIKDYPRGALLVEEGLNHTLIKMKGNNYTNTINIPQLLSKLGGNGGGHPNFATTHITGTIDEAKEKLTNQIESFP